MRSWTTLCVLLCGILAPGLSVASPEAPAEREELRKQVKRLIKQSMREGLLHHNVREFLRPYDKTAIFVNGRQREADNLDITHTFAQRKEFLRRRWRTKPTGHETLFFSNLEIRFLEDTIEAEVLTRLHFFGGERHERALFKIKVNGKKMRILHARIWPQFEAIGGTAHRYDQFHWNIVDDNAFTAILSASSDWRKILQSCLDAHWHPLLLPYLKDLIKVKPRNAEIWKALSAVSYLMGDMKGTRKASKRALSLNPSISIPPALR